VVLVFVSELVVLNELGFGNGQVVFPITIFHYEKRGSIGCFREVHLRAGHLYTDALGEVSASDGTFGLHSYKNFSFLIYRKPSGKNGIILIPGINLYDIVSSKFQAHVPVGNSYLVMGIILIGIEGIPIGADVIGVVAVQKFRLEDSRRRPVGIVMLDFIIVFLETRIQIVKRQNHVFATQTDQRGLVIGLRIE